MRWRLVAEFLKEYSRGLRRFWFPFDTPGARAQALVHAPAARDAKDIRVLIQVLDLHTVDDVLASVHEAFPEEEPPQRLRLLLEDILSDNGRP